MEVAMPMSGAAIDCYEDMFKEITRKLYGEDGLPELNHAERLPANHQERGLTPIDYDVDNPILKPEEHLTAFGLAALMQNGFPPNGILNSTFQQHSKPVPPTEDKWVPNDDHLQWTQSKIAAYNPAQKLFRCADCDIIESLPRIAEHWLGIHSNLRAFQCSQCSYESAWEKCVRNHLSLKHSVNAYEPAEAVMKNSPVLQEVLKYLQRLKNRLEGKPPLSLDDFQPPPAAMDTSSSSSSAGKRYTCTYCPYATDRRDLFTRHENIHREEKPFQCYVCQKQFNRADHVKKHFLRMHREHPYDLNRIRRHPPKNASGMSYYQKYNANTPPTDPMPINALSIPSGFNNLARNGPRLSSEAKVAPTETKSGGSKASTAKKKGEKRFSCCYCSWSGVDNWCLKRHMNTHLKPFLCGLCDYKAARSERLATHVLKVHNKRACGKCSFLADDPAQLAAHQQEHHPLEPRSRAGNNVLRNTSFQNSTATSTISLCSPNQGNLSAALQQQQQRPLQPDAKTWKSHLPKQHGAARLFNYMEASDGSEPESEARVDEIGRVHLSHRIQSDFLEAGDAGSPAGAGDDIELPLFVCRTCGCEFEDDMSLETHQYAHRHSAASPAKSDHAKENVNPNPGLKYRCRLCEFACAGQPAVMAHMLTHSSLLTSAASLRRARKQSRPKRWSLSEAEMLRRFSAGSLAHKVNRITRKYLDGARKGLRCVLCKPSAAAGRYHSKGSLALHCFWKHLNQRFKCEQCDLHFRHRYQCVLHASRDHVTKGLKSHQTVPSKEPIQSGVPGQQDAHHFFTQTVPDASTSAHKLGMSFFDHSFLHNSNAINSHMPIIIPTFPPN